MSDFPELDPSGFRDRLDDLVHAVSGSAPDQAVKQFWWDTGPELPKRWDGAAWVTGAANKAGDTFTGTVNISGAGVHPDLGDDFALEGAAPSNYPAGFTTFRDVQGSFPAGAGGVVETYNPVGSANLRQLNWNANTPGIWTRIAVDSTAWRQWVQVAYSRSARVYLGSAQSIANSTFEKVLVDTVTDDPDGLFDSANNQIDADKAGWWLVAVGVGYDGNSTGDRRYAVISHNGTRVNETNTPPTGPAITAPSTAALIKAAAGDTFEVLAWQDSGGSLSLRTEAKETMLSAAYLGSA